jgi:predicted ArsR family transcriptional regulator
VNRQSYPIARRTDPPSSHAAAQEMERTGRRASQSEALLEMVKRHPRRTALELSRLSRLDRYTVSRRLPELERRGLIRRGLIRDCTVNGRPMLTWEPVNEDPQQMKLWKNRVIG